MSAWIEEERRWLLSNTSIKPSLIAARTSFIHDSLHHRRAEPVFMHGDLQAGHVLIADGALAGVVDWGDAGLGDPLYDLAVLTMGHRDRLEDVLTGYGADVERDVVTAFPHLRRLGSVRWMTEHGFDASGDIAALSVE